MICIGWGKERKSSYADFTKNKSPFLLSPSPLVFFFFFSPCDYFIFIFVSNSRVAFYYYVVVVVVVVATFFHGPVKLEERVEERRVE